MNTFYELKFEGQYAQIPYDIQESIKRYCQDKIKPGSFLSALIQNDLKTTITNADQQNLPLIKLYVLWFHNHTSGLYGKENFINHLKK